MSRIEDGGAVEAGRDKLVERLRNAPFPNGWTQHPETLDIAEVVLDAANRIEDDAAEITRLRAENAGMRTEITRKNEALQPFADEVFRYEPDEDDDNDIAWSSDFSIGDLRRARAALSNSSQAEGQTP